MPRLLRGLSHDCVTRLSTDWLVSGLFSRAGGTGGGFVRRSAQSHVSFTAELLILPTAAKKNNRGAKKMPVTQLKF